MVMKRACKHTEYSKPDDDICIRIHSQTHAQKNALAHTYTCMKETQNIFTRFILLQPMHLFHTKVYQSIKLILKPVKIFKTHQHVSISYEIILREFVISLLRLLSFNLLSCHGFTVVMLPHNHSKSMTT